MDPVIVRNVSIGDGRPKICAPIVGKTSSEIIREARSILSLPVDVIEWRADHYEDVSETEKLLETAETLRKTVGEKPILFTFRTAREGGEKEIDAERYETLNLLMARSGHVDLIDVEIFIGDETADNIITKAHECGIKVIASNHDFQKTIKKDEIIQRLCKMQDLDADILKIALMPHSRQDVLTLLAATLETSVHHTDRPIITMSMAGLGVISRLAGECFGSALTFGAASKTSAPGQISVQELSNVLDIIHKNL